ncbi:MAG: hypothetical protein JXK07_15770, partial [Spirochaetes bacterium]|nr:hypothetical protein [Spirochaetota bacterium]MBN2769553.1 hypothetical protein [Spirochaetota bacterium]
MKNLLKLSLLQLTLLSLTCCGAGQIKTEYDSFRDVNIITMEDRYAVESSAGLANFFLNPGTFYTREISKSKSGPTEMRVIFTGNEKFDGLRPVYVNIVAPFFENNYAAFSSAFSRVFTAV